LKEKSLTQFKISKFVLENQNLMKPYQNAIYMLFFLQPFPFSISKTIFLFAYICMMNASQWQPDSSKNCSRQPAMCKAQIEDVQLMLAILGKKEGPVQGRGSKREGGK